ncbi:MAG: GHKL domain-containing protein [Blautia sp.]|nr:GHKL domain-containing protein [Blautia sp.]
MIETIKAFFLLGGFDYSNISYCVELLAAILLYFVYIRKRKHFGIRLLAGSLLLLICSIWLYPAMRNSSTLVSFCWFPLVYLLIAGICYLSYAVTWKDALYGATCGYLTQHFTSSLFILILFEGKAPEWNGLFYPVLYVLIYALFFIIFSKRLTDNGIFGTSKVNVLTLTLITLTVSAVLSSLTKVFADFAELSSDSTAYIVLFRICQVYDMLICLFLLILQMVLKRELRAQKRYEMNRNIWEQRRQQYELTRENIDLMNRKCHDLKHQIAAFSDKNVPAERRDSFLREMEDMVEIYDTHTQTGNEALDTILQEKGLFCKMHHIQWNCIADGEILQFMDVVDIYTLLGNAIDNAIEAVEQLKEPEKKMISVRILQKNHFAVIQIENPYEGSVSMQEGKIRTTKSDKDYHGFGIKSMRHIAEKYNGSLSVKTDNGMFLLYAVLPVEGEAMRRGEMS